MPRKATGQVIERDGKRGRTYALRFRAYGERRFLTLGTARPFLGTSLSEALRATYSLPSKRHRRTIRR